MAVVGIGIRIRIRIRIGVGTGDVSPILGRFFLCFLVFNAKPSSLHVSDQTGNPYFSGQNKANTDEHRFVGMLRICVLSSSFMLNY